MQAKAEGRSQEGVIAVASEPKDAPVPSQRSTTPTLCHHRSPVQNPPSRATAKSLAVALDGRASVSVVEDLGFTVLGRYGGLFLRPNVRAKGATTAGRQARAGENVPRTARPGLVACRWRSA